MRGIPQQRTNIIPTTPGSGTAPLTVVSSPPCVGLSNSPTNAPSHFNKVIILVYYQTVLINMNFVLGTNFNSNQWTLTKFYKSK